ncbi:hypothetical protein V3H18_01505 [Methylocystis sp. 9N]|uniref:Uncharacterized protein n=1 Tax=Methylocystis borbori TaxID=3118750 RepID=A0ABU7XDY7_9HYPH
MPKRFDANAAAVAAKSRKILLNAAACFVGASLLALLPQDWRVDEIFAPKETAVEIDAVSGKFLARVETEETLSSPEEKIAAPILASLPAYGKFDIASDEASAWDEEKPSPAAAKPIREAPKKQARTADPQIADSVAIVPTPPIRPSAANPAAEAVNRGAETAERHLLAGLSPSALSSKLAPIAQGAWRGATSLGSSLAGLLEDYRF